MDFLSEKDDTVKHLLAWGIYEVGINIADTPYSLERFILHLDLATGLFSRDGHDADTILASWG